MGDDARSITACQGGNGFAYYVYARASTREIQAHDCPGETVFITANACAKAFLLALLIVIFSFGIAVAPAFAEPEDVDTQNESLSSCLYAQGDDSVLKPQGEDPANTGAPVENSPEAASQEGGEDAAGASGALASNVGMIALLGKDGELVIRSVQSGDAELAKILGSLEGENGAANSGATDDGLDQSQGQQPGSDEGDGPLGKDPKDDNTENAGSGEGLGSKGGGAGDQADPAAGNGGGASQAPLLQGPASPGGEDPAASAPGAGYDPEALKRLADGLVAVYALSDGSISEGSHAPWYDKRGMIRSVSFGQGVTPNSMAFWFADLVELRKIDFTGLDTSNVANMQQLFSDCWLLDNLDLKGFNTSSVTSMASMFSGCKKVSALDLSGFDTSKVTSMSGMFAGAEALQLVNLTSFDTSNVEDMTGMFSGCTSVKSLNLSSFKTTSLKSNAGMFTGCKSLAALDVSGFTANQLSAASIPTDNEGGFWLMNVPADFKADVVLREPSPEEKASYVENPNKSGDEPKPDPAVDPKRDEGEKGESGVNPPKPSVPERVDPTPPVNNIDNPVNQGAAQADIEQPAIQYGPSYSIVTTGQGNTPTVQLPGATPSVTDQLPNVVINLVSPTGRSLDPALDFDQVAAATTTVLQALGLGPAADKTLAMTIAALGMIIAAGLVLTLCFKIR